MANEDTNSILTGDNANRAIQGNVAMPATQPDGKICMWCHLLANFATNSSGATWRPNLYLMQVAPSGGHASSAKLEPMEVAFFVAGEMTQVKEAIPWVRCASGNIYIVGQMI